MSLEEKARQRIETLHNCLHKNGIHVSVISMKDYNYEFIAESGKSKVKVQVYFGKKGIKTVLQGDDKSDFYRELKTLIWEEPELELHEQKLNEPEKYIGTDECGKGDFFGPLVVAAVYVNNETKKKLHRIGVRDSKELSDYQIGILAKEIKKIIKENFAVVKINPDKYNEIYNQFGNLNKLLNWAHSKALSNLFGKIDCKFVITDKFSNKELDISLLSKHSDVEFIQETKAEKYVGVAAASILARENFIHWFEFHSRKGLNLPKGSSITTETYAEKLLEKIGENKLAQLAKLHFKTFKKIKSK